MNAGFGFAGTCVVISGVLLNVYLAVVARGLSPAEYSYFASFWSLALVAGFGAFLPLEQELGRRLHVEPHARALRTALSVAVTGALVACIVVVVAAPLLLDSFGGRAGTLAALAALCFVSAGQFALRGWLIGTGRLDVYGWVMVADTLLRVILAAIVWFAQSGSSVHYAWTLVLAIGFAHLPLLIARLLRAAQGTAVTPHATRVDASGFARSIGPLLVGSIGGQILLNGVPVAIAAVTTAADQALAGRFAAAFFLARVPLFVIVPLQTALLPLLIPLLSGGNAAQFKRVFAWFGSGIAVLLAAGLLVASTFGPWLVRLIFGPAYTISSFDLALMVAGVVFHIGVIVITQALIASGLHDNVAWSWIGGIAVAGMAFALIPDLLLRAEIAFLSGSAAGLAVGICFLIAAARRIHR